MKRYFVVLSREKGYRKKPIKYEGIIKSYYRKYPLVIEAMLKRHIVYNRILEELEELESEGKAFLVYPKTMPVSSRQISYNKLSESYLLGYTQGQEDLPQWKKFLDIV